MKRVYMAMNPPDAHLLTGVLESEGIEAVVQGEFLWIARGEVPITTDTAPSVWVKNDADYERAIKIVNQFQSPENISGSEWKCANCNEFNEGQFTECWNCGTPRIGS